MYNFESVFKIMFVILFFFCCYFIVVVFGGVVGCVCVVLGVVLLIVVVFLLVDVIVKDVFKGWNQCYLEICMEVISCQYDDYYMVMMIVLLMFGYLFDVIVLEMSYLGCFLLGFGLDDLFVLVFGVECFKDCFVFFVIEMVCNCEGCFVVMLIDIGLGLLFYCVDLLVQVGFREVDLMCFWEDYVEVGVQLKVRIGVYLIGDVCLFKDIIVCVGMLLGEGQFFDKQGWVQVILLCFVCVFELVCWVWQQGLDVCVEVWFNDWVEMFKCGCLVIEMLGCWMVGQMVNWVVLQMVGKWCVVQLFENVYCFYGGIYYVILCCLVFECKQFVWQFIQELMLDCQCQFDVFCMQDVFLVLLVVQEDFFFEQFVFFFGGQYVCVLW